MVGDPFGLRKAILPVFERTPVGDLIGMGTAVHLDGWGGFLTAEHVIEFLRSNLPNGGLTGEPVLQLDPTTQSHATVMLGIGLVFGRVAVPEWAFAPIIETLFITQHRDNPLAALRGEPELEVEFDIAGFQAAIPAAAYADGKDPPKTLPVLLNSWAPVIGETVLAFGYPELKPSAPVSDATLKILVEDGLFAAYGKITEIFPEGRDRMNRTPVFEVEANWPSGMSGGPVVNEAGKVVGIVSRSLAPDDEFAGVGYAACLPWIGEVRRLAPRVDPYNPGFRLGYTVQSGSNRFEGFCPDFQVASQYASRLGCGYSVMACSHRIGTDKYFLQEHKMS
jgi:serine protease Do